MKNLRFTLLAILLASGLQAQEFNAKVVINTPKLQLNDPKIFRTLEQAIMSFYNERIWTSDQFKPEERIELSINITINKEISDTKFEGQMIIQSSRPVYNSTYSTVMLENLDKDFLFEYVEFQPIDYSDNQYITNLASVLGFYAYVALGLDYDSFSELGGESYFQKAQQVIGNVPTEVQDQYPGWKPFGGTRNRYWLIENMLNVRMQGVRRSMYAYHLAGLDQMVNNAGDAQGVILSVLRDWQKASNDYPNTMWMQLLCNAKREEISNMFSTADMKTRQDVVNIMARLDPTQADEYRKMLNKL